MFYIERGQSPFCKGSALSAKLIFLDGSVDLCERLLGTEKEF